VVSGCGDQARRRGGCAMSGLVRSRAAAPEWFSCRSSAQGGGEKEGFVIIMIDSKRGPDLHTYILNTF
jgi:hypothetical protein